MVSLGPGLGERGLSVILMLLATSRQGYQNKTFAAGTVVQPLKINKFCYFYSSITPAYLLTKTPIKCSKLTNFQLIIWLLILPPM